MTLDEITETFDLLDDWEERYRYVIELGRSLPPFPEEARTDANLVPGCTSRVWLVCHTSGPAENPTLTFLGDSDAHIVRGLVAILLTICSGHTAQEILALDTEAIFGRLGLRAHITPQRSNGLTSMVRRIRQEAGEALSAAG